MEHFSQANPHGPGMDNVPELLRRVAKTIEDHGEICVHDLILHTEVKAEGYWPSLTVYYSTDPDDVRSSRWTATESE